MASKPHNQPGRRTPLSLSGVTKQNYSNKNAVSSSGSTISNTNTKQDKTSLSQQLIDAKDSSQKDFKKQQHQQQIDKKSDEKKSTQNGEQNGKSNLVNQKEKLHQQQKQQFPQEQQEKQQSSQASGNNEFANGQNITDEKLEKKNTSDKVEKLEKNANQSLEHTLKQTKEVGKLSTDKKDKERVSEKKEKEVEKKLEIKLKKTDAKSSVSIDQNKIKQNEVRLPTASPKINEKIKPEKLTNTKELPCINTDDNVLPSSKKLNVSTKTAIKNILIDNKEDIAKVSVKIVSSPAKSKPKEVIPAAIITPSATSTPGKVPENKLPILTNVEAQLKTDNDNIPLEPINCVRTFSQVSCRRSIRPMTEYTPSSFKINQQFRESYRRINTELDVSSITNTSTNVTIGSEVPNNSSFSFFGRGRKRDRTPPPHSQSAIELQNDAALSPPKRRRLDLQNFFSAVASPLTLLRARFAKNSIQNNSPEKNCGNDDKGEVENVSGITIEEEIPHTEKEMDEIGGENQEAKTQLDIKEQDNENEEPKKCILQSAQTTAIEDEANFDIPMAQEVVSEDVQAKDKKCNIM